MINSISLTEIALMKDLNMNLEVGLTIMPEVNVRGNVQGE